MAFEARGEQIEAEASVDGRAQAVSAHARRLPGLDGLRAVAVTAVFLFHANLSWARGGYLGVDLFFVISGFLITGLLARERESTGRIDLWQFYWRRAKRLFPASWLMVACAIVAAAVLAPDALHRLRGDAGASMVYLTNWELLSAGTSYFETMGRQPLLLHLWSLAVEEQFYIVWAPLMLVLLPAMGRKALAVLVLIAAAASVAWMAVLAAKMGYVANANSTRLFFGTDTHGFCLLIGAALGLLWQPRPLARAVAPALSDRVFSLGLATLGGLLALFALMGEETAWLYPWGFLTAAGASCVLIAAATWPGSIFGRWLDQQPLRWLGERSYGIYLWHWPIFMLTRPELDLGLDANVILAIRAALTLTIAALSYSFVEMPIRRGLLGRIWRGLAKPDRRGVAAAQGVATAIVAGLVLATALAALYPPPGAVRQIRHLRQVIDRSELAQWLKPKPVAKPPAVPETPAPLTPYTGQDVTAVGDSVMLGSSRTIEDKLSGTKIYATVGWQAADAEKQIQALIDSHELRPVVVIHLGTNGYVYETQLRHILALLSDRKRVIIVNTHVQRRWMKPNNDLIARIVPDYPNVMIADWRTVSEGQTTWFVADGVHLTPAGQRAYIAEIMRAGHLVAVPVCVPVATTSAAKP